MTSYLTNALMVAKVILIVCPLSQRMWCYILSFKFVEKYKNRFVFFYNFLMDSGSCFALVWKLWPTDLARKTLSPLLHQHLPLKKNSQEKFLPFSKKKNYKKTTKLAGDNPNCSFNSKFCCISGAAYLTGRTAWDLTISAVGTPGTG